ncbi:ribosome-binding factor A [Lentisphaera araneosa HTCC2155]|uniref:Ribosome-binding factor A n=1 Tax=Lentisphaera araneosa HTCC2155 TaxID=313628 RepID=A6DGZ4_9BACT|nr:30S ribosome-binding factor RbfA [Lentisphaera araneosa]EDM28877.1 ribosome-binding factor A [Lentisphaera araneosa HTCC2155]
MSKDRMRSVDSTIQKELSSVFIREVFPCFECLITVTGVKTSADLRHCNVYVSVMGSNQQKEDVIRFLRDRSEEFFNHLSKRIRMKFTPVIHWHCDDTPETADRLSSLIDSIDIPSEDED